MFLFFTEFSSYCAWRMMETFFIYSESNILKNCSTVWIIWLRTLVCFAILLELGYFGLSCYGMYSYYIFIWYISYFWHFCKLSSQKNGFRETLEKKWKRKILCPHWDMNQHSWTSAWNFKCLWQLRHGGTHKKQTDNCSVECSDWFRLLTSVVLSANALCWLSKGNLFLPWHSDALGFLDCTLWVYLYLHC